MTPPVYIPVSSINVSLFARGITHTKDGKVYSVARVFECIRDPELKAKVNWLRQCASTGDDSSADEAKRTLPVICWGGLFRHRANEGVEAVSGLVVCDVDDIENAGEVRDKLKEDHAIVGAFVSPSGKGVKIVVATSCNNASTYTPAWRTAGAYLKTRWDIDIDPSGSDISRACFASYDPDAWDRNEAIPLAIDTTLMSKDPPLPTYKAGEMTRIRKDRHQYLMTYQGRLASLGLGIEEIMVASRQMVTDKFDVSDGRVFPDAELRRGAEGAYSKFNTGDSIAAIVDGYKIREHMEQAKEEADRIQAALMTKELAAHISPWPAELLSGWPGVIDAICNDINLGSFRHQPALALGAALTAFGTVIGRQVCSPTNLRANLYSIGLCKTGGGKDAARKYVKDLFNKSGIGLESPDNMLHPEQIASEAGLIASVRQRKTGIFLIDELGRYMKSMNGKNAASHESGIITSLLMLYTSSESTFTGKAYADTKLKPCDPIDQPCVCIYGVSNPADFYESMSSRDSANGFLPRLLVFEVDDHTPERQHVAKTSPNSDLVKRLTQWATRQTGIDSVQTPDPTTIPYADDAVAELWMNYGRETDRQMIKADDAGIGRELWSRAWDKAMKVALICACAEKDPEQIADMRITMEHSQKAIMLVNYTTERLEVSSRGMISDNGYEATVKRVESIISFAGPHGVTRALLGRRFRSLKSREMTEILETMEESGIIVLQVPDAEKGRPAVSYRHAMFVAPADMDVGESFTADAKDSDSGEAS